MKKRMKVVAAMFMAGSVFLAACAGQGGAGNTASSAGSSAAEAESAEEEAAGEASDAEEEAENADAGESTGEEDTITEADGGEKAILAVSFGTSYNDSRNITIGGIENALREAFPDFEVRRAFTAQIIIDKLAERDNIVIDNVKEALDRAVSDGVKTLIVQPTHLMNGFEYTDLKEELEAYEDSFEQLALAEPLLTSDEDFEAVAEAIVSHTEKYDDGKTAIAFMGHGTEAESNSVYAKMQEVLSEGGHDNYYVGTVEAEPTVEDVIEAISGKGYERVVLEPLMVVAGDHANNDMAGDEEDSWKSIIEAEGYEVECVLDGLGQIEAIDNLYVEHTRDAVDSLGTDVDNSVAFGAVQSVQSDTAVLAVSFGTSYNDSRHITIGGIENALREAFPEYQLRRAFTAQIIIDKLASRDNVVIDNVGEALERAAADGIKKLIVQPTHLMNGFEYTDLKDELEQYGDKFDSISLAEPLLTSDEDFEAVAKAITAHTEKYDDGKTAIAFMGHGTEAASNSVYAKMQEVLSEGGHDNYYVGTVEAEPTVEDVIEAISGKGYERVVLEPLMVVAGDHANNDMAGDEEDSWKSIIEAEGYEVECVLDGLGQIYDIQQIYVEHAKAADDDKVADASDYAGEEAVGFEGMEAVEADALNDGTYEIDVDSSSSMFRIAKCALNAEGGEMTADMTLSGKGYLYLYPGTPEEAAEADEADYIGYEEDADGAYVYTFPVEALNKEVQCAAFSEKKKQWYERTLVFRADTLPEGALK